MGYDHAGAMPDHVVRGGPTWPPPVPPAPTVGPPVPPTAAPPVHPAAGPVTRPVPASGPVTRPAGGPVIYPVPTPAAGRLSILPAPRGGDQLEADLRALAASGVHALVCLLPKTERLAAGLGDEPDAAGRAGLEFHRLPIPDFGVPDRVAAAPLLDLLAARIRAGRHVAVHCRAGIGRSSLVAAALLVRLGTPVTDVWRVISEARGCPVPETDAQRRWLTEGGTGPTGPSPAPPGTTPDGRASRPPSGAGPGPAGPPPVPPGAVR